MAVLQEFDGLKKLVKLFCGEFGQSTTEYGIIVFFCVLMGLLFTDIFIRALADYHAIVSSVVCLPVP